MKKLTTMTAVLALSLGAVACDAGGDMDADTTTAAAAAEGISGDWMIDIDSAEFESSEDEWVLADGTYECKSCDTPYSVPADGEWHAVELPGTDEVMVEEVDDRTVKFSGRHEGEVVYESSMTVSEDGQSATGNFKNMRGAEVVEGSNRWTRVEAGADGSHAVSGKWMYDDVETVSDAGLRASFNVEGDQFSWQGNSGSYTATLGGEPVAVEGSDSGEMVKVEQIGENSYRETFMRDGEEQGTTEWTVGEDGRLNGLYRNAKNGDVTRFSATRV
ncbi:hypothetical protein [Sphingomicrobium aestuariivivum]|uniref:hypothetical protein n=1 Tax=Sphingomicrobium aestuariivivum TaxID=1582356 RepID=UPI001FD6EE7A|nr:hypothetical protein [Sphingomicrobium aestuariivivum]MCJ8191645.1 hypothetical protein [Sphingomicrobium aestuariivivum]